MSLAVDGLDQASDALGHALLVEQEVAAGALEQTRVEQRDRRVDHRVAVLQRGLEDAVGLLDGRPDVLDQVVQAVGAGAREPRDVHPGGELEEDVHDARFGDPHRVGQRARLADHDARVRELDPRRALEGDRAGAGPGADQHGDPLRQVRSGLRGKRLGAVRGPDDHDELGAVHRLADVVTGVADRREALEVAGRTDATRPAYRCHVLAELRRGIQRDVVAVLGEVERRGDASVARSENCHPHPDLLM